MGDELRDELLAKRKRDLRERRLGLGMRVIYVGFDEDVVQFNSHLRKLPKDWLALPFASEQGRARAAALRSLFPAASRTLPAVAIIDAEPQRGVLAMDALTQIEADPEAQRCPWPAPAVFNFRYGDCGLALNNEPSLVLLMEDFGEPDRYNTTWEAGRDLTPEQEKAVADLEEMASDEIDRAREAGVEPRWRAYVATTTGTMATQIRHIIGGISRVPLLVMLDLPEGVFYVSDNEFDGVEVGAVQLRYFVEAVAQGQFEALPVVVK